MPVVGTYTERVSDTLIGEGDGVNCYCWDAKRSTARLLGHILIIHVSYMAYSRKHDYLFRQKNG